MSTVYGDYEVGTGSRQQGAGWSKRALSSLLAGLGRVISWPAHVLEARRELEMLSRMSESELKDIGLTVSDVGDATALPADMSPTHFLAHRVEERYRARHGVNA
jgi:uncharacterized protein YjiS (DUF1127 family)